MILVQPTLRIINNLGRRITCPCEEAPSIKNQVDDFNMDLSRRIHVEIMCSGKLQVGIKA
jgi:hypothetical protein